MSLWEAERNRSTSPAFNVIAMIANDLFWSDWYCSLAHNRNIRTMQSEYIEQRHGGYYVAGTRISLDSVVCSFNEGQSPEAIQENFPSLKRAQIYGAIAFYLDHQTEIDKYLMDTLRAFEGNAIPLEDAHPALWAKIQRAKAEAAQGERF